MEFFLNNSFLKESIFWVGRLWFLWVPFILGYVFWNTWLMQIRGQFLKNQKWTLLEIKLPREIHKGPQAMEIILGVFYSTKDGNMLEKYWQGYLRSWSSLEIVGINGEIHFFVYTSKFMRNLIESQFYAQYPGIEIMEVDDYTMASHFDDFDEWRSWGTEFALTKEDAYPIRTYVDFGLHETVTKEEQKTDPITAFLEYLGSLKKEEQVWFQILIRATKKKWTEEGKQAIDGITGISGGSSLEDRMKAMAGLTSGQQDVIKAIERSVSKKGFDVGIRSLYLAKKDIYSGVHKAAILGTMARHNSLTLNGFKPQNKTDADYFFVERRETKMAREMISAYRKRAYFYPPHVGKSFVLNTEELATIYHFPGGVAETPTFERIGAKKGEPPTNLPV